MFYTGFMILDIHLVVECLELNLYIILHGSLFDTYLYFLTSEHTVCLFVVGPIMSYL